MIVLGVATVTLVAVAVLRKAGVPAAVVLVVAGLIIGFLPFVPDVSLDPDVVLLGLLPLLVFDAAVTSSPTAFLRNARSIGVLAVGLVVATAFGVAAVAHWLGHLSWSMAFVLGTAVGPTDASAATSIGRRLGLPRRLLTVLEGEALFNDATALVLYAAAVTAATTGHFSVLHTTGSIVYSTAAGAAIGLAVGLAGRWLRNRVDDPPIEIAGSILVAYAAYLPAEALHASGVLSAVFAGLYLGWHSSGGAFSARSRLQPGAFWATLVFLVNAALFVLVGLSFHTFSSGASGRVGRLALTGAGVVLTVILVRLIWMEGLIVTLVGQGMTLPALVRRLRLSEHPSVADAERQVRLQITQAVLDHLGEAADHDGLPEELADGLRAQYLARLHRLEASGDEVDLEDEVAATAQAELVLRRDLIAFQRRTLSDMHDQGRVGITTLRRVEHDLDLEEARVSPP